MAARFTALDQPELWADWICGQIAREAGLKPFIIARTIDEELEEAARKTPM